MSTNNEDTEKRGATGEPAEIIQHETIQYWPPANYRKRPEWTEGNWTLYERLAALTDEMYRALANDQPVLAAIGMRTVLDHATEILGIDPGATFENKLMGLLGQGRISSDE